MENVLGEDIPIGIYRTNDKIQNFKIRVKVRKSTNACFAEKDSLGFGDSNEAELVNLMQASTISVERVLGWQEKSEKTGSREVNSDTKDSLRISIFSYTDDDLVSSRWKTKASCTYPASYSSPLESRKSEGKHQSKTFVPNTESWQKPLFSNVRHIVREKSGVGGGSPLPANQSMVIMAALFFDDSSTSEEIELCYLKVDDHGTLTVIPDFTKRKSFTFVNSRSETFEYELENASNVLKSSICHQEKILMKKIEMYKRKLKDEVIGTEFIKIDPGTMSFSLNCEIVSAENFSAADIFVHYLVSIPKDWKSESILEGITETCRSKLKNDVKISYYGYTFSVDVSTDIENYKDEPFKIVFETTSVDYWGNFRNEGYGYFEMSLNSKTQVHKAYTWKLEPRTLEHRLQNFFIGGMPHLEDLSYIINPKEIKDSQLSKYGVKTLTSGSVTFKTSILLQKTES
ncbi:hypothetical protein JTE90_017231 [Oedothorax gibbosus]|uniref:Meckel syndrome type 1 protein n=1 Tax=Oedothorax gibbosus TaxID=931172 RepID=A0AAV6VDF7_9ARAC|nr:hypothetical protein JTE90_017231 [Oedothorax gibbosus]